MKTNQLAIRGQQEENLAAELKNWIGSQVAFARPCLGFFMKSKTISTDRWQGSMIKWIQSPDILPFLRYLEILADILSFSCSQFLIRFFPPSVFFSHGFGLISKLLLYLHGGEESITLAGDRHCKIYFTVFLLPPCCERSQHLSQTLALTNQGCSTRIQNYLSSLSIFGYLGSAPHQA